MLLADSVHLLRGRAVGLITNQTGVDRDGTSGIDRLFAAQEAAGFRLAVLFSPEHGIRGRAEAGRPVADEIDRRTGLPIHSLYGGTRRPEQETLAGLDALLYDLQDVGARYYTYTSTMAFAMEEAGRAGIPFIVLDRPNPLGGQAVQGNVLDPAFSSFVGLYPVPMRHGMTPGELARLYAGRFGVEVELHVVPLEGWTRDRWFDETGLPWIPPSPNLPSLASATHYPGTCLFEGTRLSVGRGTEAPFQQVGAPWLDAPLLAERLNGLALAGVRFEAVQFTPREPGDGKYGGVEVAGVRWVLTDREAYDPTVAAAAALREARRLGGEAWEWASGHFDRLAGTDRLRRVIEEGRPLDEIIAPWDQALAGFRTLREPYLLY